MSVTAAVTGNKQQTVRSHCTAESPLGSTAECTKPRTSVLAALRYRDSGRFRGSAEIAFVAALRELSIETIAGGQSNCPLCVRRVPSYLAS